MTSEACASLAGRAYADPKYRALMVRRVVRTAMIASFVLAMWTVARPAHAATLAPFCDDRGATSLAPPPALEAPDEAIRRTRASTCDGNGTLPGHVLAPGHHRIAAPSCQVEPGQPVRPPTLVPVRSASVDFVVRAVLRSRGVRGRVDRPPRA
jgi:hypothetical protein